MKKWRSLYEVLPRAPDDEVDVIDLKWSTQNSLCSSNVLRLLALGSLLTNVIVVTLVGFQWMKHSPSIMGFPQELYCKYLY
jgi:hypothetical protein